MGGDEVLVIRAQRIFDGERMLGRGMILVEDGRIMDVDLSGADPPPQARMLELDADATLLPGLIDCHTHLILDATGSALTHVAETDDLMLLQQMRRAATSALSAGITTMRDLGDRNYLSLVLARQSVAGDPSRLPEIIASGPPITVPGGHLATLGGEATGAPALRAAIRARAERGCQFVKVIASGGNLTPGSRPETSQYSLSDLRVVVEEAHRVGLRTAAHAHARSAINDALEAGFDTLEHVTFFTRDSVESDPGIIERIASRGTFVSLTIGNVPGASAPPVAVAQRMESMLENARRLSRSGAPIVLGPDGGTTPGKPHRVLPFAVEAAVRQLEMSSTDALRAVTSVASAACGVQGRKGRIARGADADLLVINGDPIADITAIHDVAAVVRAGCIVSR